MSIFDFFKINKGTGKIEDGTFEPIIEAIPQKTPQEKFDEAVQEVIAKRQLEEIENSIIKYLVGEEVYKDTKAAIEEYGEVIFPPNTDDIVLEWAATQRKEIRLKYPLATVRMGDKIGPGHVFLVIDPLNLSSFTLKDFSIKLAKDVLK